jgi:hypothetical protein
MPSQGFCEKRTLQMLQMNAFFPLRIDFNMSRQLIALQKNLRRNRYI